MSDRHFQALPSLGQLVSSICTTYASEGEPFNSDDNASPSLGKILARPKQVIDLTLNDDGDRDGDDDNATEVSWLRIT
jgi:hypothetical protein